MSKKLVCLFLLAMLIGMLIWGGIGSAATKTKLKPYEVKWYFIGNGPPRDVELIEQEVSKYLKDKINTRVKLYCFDWGSYNNKMAVIQASGEPFDIAFSCSWANYYRQQVSKGYFLDITTLLNKYAPKTKKQLHPAFISGSAIDGKNYAIPANKELAHQWGFMFRKDIVEKYKLNIDAIKKFEDIEPMLKVIQENEPEMIPLQAVGGENGFPTLDFDRPGDDGVPGVLYNDSKNMKIFNELDSPEYKAYLKTIRKFYVSGYIPQDAPSITNFNEGRKAGKVFCSINSLKPFGDLEGTAANGFPLKQIALTQPVVQTRDCTGSMQAISVTSPDPARALMFLEYFNTDKFINNLINFGIEGKHFVKKGDNVIGFPEGVTGQNSGYRPGTPWVFGNQYINYFWVGENLAKWDAFREFNNSAMVAKSVGFNVDNELIKNEIAACLDVNKQYMNALNTGSVDPDEVLPQALAKFKAAGVDKVVAEKQRQLDAWLAKTAKTKKK